MAEKSDDKKNKATVEIFGSSYALRGPVEAERISRLAGFVDERMKKTANANPKLPPLKIAVLVALNIADEYQKLEDDYLELLELLKMDEASKK